MAQEKFYLDEANTDYQSTKTTQESFLNSIELDNSEFAAESILHLAETYRRTSNYPKALELFRQSFSLWMRVGKLSRAAWSLWGIASVYRLLARYTESNYWYRAAARLARPIDLRCYFWTHAGLAEVYRVTGLYSVAIAYHQELLEAFERAGDQKGVSWALAGLAQMHKLIGNFKSAQELFIKSEFSARKDGDKVAIAYALRGQSEIAKLAGYLDVAEVFADLSIELFSSKKYEVGLAYSLKTLSEIKLAQYDLTTAHDIALSSLETFEKSERHRGTAYGLITLANVESKLSEFASAERHLLLAQSLLDSAGVKEADEYSVRRGLGELQTYATLRKFFFP